MTTAFEFSTATEIVFGRGRVGELGRRVAPLGRRVLFVVGSNPERARAASDSLEKEGLTVTKLPVTGEPTTDVACRGVEIAQESGCEVVVGVGGGSVLDAGKAIAALLGNGGDPLDYLEVVGRGKPLVRPSVPYVAVPTTSGTGSEVTKNAVLESRDHRVKVSLRGHQLLPRIALVDSLLTHSVPPDVTAATGLDALTQVIEPYVSCRANPMTDALCIEGIKRSARSLTRAYEDGDDPDAREDLALTSLFGGLALANAKLGAVHGFAAPLGGMFHGPHGAICARLLPLVMEANIAALLERAPQSPVLERYTHVSRLLTGRSGARAEDGPVWVAELTESMGIPLLRAYGMTGADIPAVVEKARKSSSMQGNPIELTSSELALVLERALEGAPLSSSP